MTTDQEAAKVLCKKVLTDFLSTVSLNPYVLANPALVEVCHETMSAIDDAYKAIGENT